MLPFRVQWHPGTSRGTSGSRVERLEKRATIHRVYACMGRTPFPVWSFFGFRSFRPRALEKKVEGGGMRRERKCLTDGGGEDRGFVQFWKTDFDLDLEDVIFGGVEEVGIVIMDLPIAKLNISSRYLESLGIYGSDNSNWSNGEDLLARHVRSCTSKSC